MLGNSVTVPGVGRQRHPAHSPTKTSPHTAERPPWGTATDGGHAHTAPETSPRAILVCAVKRFRYSHDDSSLVQTFKNEVFLLRNLSHENLVTFYGAPTRSIFALCSCLPLFVHATRRYSFVCRRAAGGAASTSASRARCAGRRAAAVQELL
eukprot:COSAG01_NODE_15876_length_1289_cov_1.710084_1_plen_152_part_00